MAWAKQKNGGITPPNIFISNSDLVVMGSKDADNSIQSAVKFFKENQITELSIPKEIVFVEKLPLLGTGKIDYVAARNLYQI